MMREAATTLWSHFRLVWVEPGITPADPRLAADAGMSPLPSTRYLSPLVGAWLH